MKKDTILKIDMGNITIKVVMQGFWHGEGRPESLMHNHTVFEFHMMMRGSALLETDQKSIELTQKDSVLIPPKAFHSFKNKEKGSAIISFTFFVEKNRAGGGNYERLIEEKLKTANEPIVFAQNLQIEEFFTKIVASMYSQSIVAQDRTKALFILLFAEIFSLFEDKENKVYEYGSDFAQNDSIVFMIGEYFNEYYMEDISLKNLSERLYLSTKQTDKMIKKAFGEGFRQHLCKIRLLIAKNLLRDTNMEVREIADSVGYKSYNGFYMAFKQNVKMTPQQYREKQRSN